MSQMHNAPSQPEQPPEVLPGTPDPALQGLNRPLAQERRYGYDERRAAQMREAQQAENSTGIWQEEYEEERFSEAGSEADHQEAVNLDWGTAHPLDMGDYAGSESEDESSASRDSSRTPSPARHVGFEPESPVSESGSSSSNDYITINTQFSPSMVRPRRSANARVNRTVNTTQRLQSSPGGGSQEDIFGLTLPEDQPSREPDDFILINTQLSPPAARQANASLDHDSRAIVIGSSPNNGTQPNDVAQSTTHATPSTKRRRSKSQAGDEGSAKQLKRKHEGDAKKAKSGTHESNAAGKSGSGEDMRLRTRVLFKCAVCLDMPDPAVFVHPCGHVFCEGCAQGAAQSTKKCPVCRHTMRSKDIRVLQFRIAPIKR
ncbi:hypothetical protein GGI07_003626 [Coemansia sp. Benny D115]|nr:hypothetical protein GGI07_003626 [Coemansia sp. Benny D115]